jgi:hypothetical protein
MSLPPAKHRAHDHAAIDELEAWAGAVFVPSPSRVALWCPPTPHLTFPCIVGVYCSSSFGSWERQSAVRVTHTLNKTRPNTRPPALFLTTAVRTLAL